MLKIRTFAAAVRVRELAPEPSVPKLSAERGTKLGPNSLKTLERGGKMTARPAVPLSDAGSVVTVAEA